MLSLSIEQHLTRLLAAEPGLRLSSFRYHSIGGGSINETYQVIINHNIKFFLKVNSSTEFPALFIKEKSGIEFLGEQKIIKVPAVIACTEIDQHQILLLEWIEGGLRTEKFWKEFGRQLAQLHIVTNTDFGLGENNYMGALPQKNNQKKSWPEFFIQCRLEPQIKIALDKGLLQSKAITVFDRLFLRIPEIFDEEKPSLLHGDLWSGNFMCDQHSEPVLIDPAIYFGHRSVDLAMTTLFGGFDKDFYESYHYHFPFPPNYKEQWEICNLYPLLIHLNLFGAGYLSEIEGTLRKYR
jgi:fructosamine-3-kinase